MALQFHPNIKNAFVYNGLTLAGVGSQKVFPAAAVAPITSFSVYSGTQATAAELITNWATINANQRLAHYVGTGQLPTFTRTGSTLQITGFPTITPNALATGIASWAVIWYSGSNTTLAVMSNPTPPATLAQFLIVPVTTTATNGVFRYSNLQFTAGQPCPSIADGAVSFF